MSSYLEFYRRRECEERATAAQSEDSRIAAIHLEMAELYARLIALETGAPLLKEAS